jgi:hypothetical protein
MVGRYAAFVAVIATLASQFAKTLALGLSIGNLIAPSVTSKHIFLVH